MDDLISRSALLAAYDKAHQGPPGGARKLIENAPGAIVRCRDCKWRKNNGATSTKWLPCMEMKTRNDWFCADGERAENARLSSSEIPNS